VQTILVYLPDSPTILTSGFNIQIIEEPEKDADQAEMAEGSEFAEGDEDDGEKKEYVKKDFVARPYISDGVTEEQVNSLIVKNTRYVFKYFNSHSSLHFSKPFL
jgi:hypothetical protein